MLSVSKFSRTKSSSEKITLNSFSSPVLPSGFFGYTYKNRIVGGWDNYTSAYTLSLQSTPNYVSEDTDYSTLAFDDKSELVKINDQVSQSINDKNGNKKFKKEKFGEINFNYPNWSPSSFEVDSNKDDLKSKDLINKKYMDIESGNIGSNLNLKL